MYIYIYTAITDENGKAWIWVPTGNYTVYADMEDYVGRALANFTVTGTPVTTGATAQVLVNLHMGQVIMNLTKNPGDQKVYDGTVQLNMLLTNTLSTTNLLGETWNRLTKDIKWFREPLNSANIYNETTFNTAYGLASSENKGTFPNSVDTLINYSMAVNENARYWFYAVYSDGSPNEPWIKVDYIDVNNIYTPYEIFERGYAVPYNEYLYGTSQAYWALTDGNFNNIGIVGIPYDLGGTAVLNDPFGGYDQYTIYKKAQYADNWDAHIKSPSGPSASKTYIMDGTFAAADSDSLPFDKNNKRIEYTVYYEKNNKWNNVKVAFRDKKGEAIVDTSNQPVSWLPNPQEYGESDPNSINFPFPVPIGLYYTDFYDKGGRYLPPEDPGKDWFPIGYYVGTIPYDAAVHGENAWTPVSDFSFFDPVGVWCDDSVDPLPPVVTIIYSSDVSVVREHYVREDSRSIKLAPDGRTVTVANYTKSPRSIPGYVPVGYIIEGTTHLDGIHMFNYKTISPSLDNPTSSQHDHEFFTVHIPLSEIGDNTHVTWLYEEEIFPGTGIPRSDGIAITANWIGVPLTGNIVTLKSEIIYSRKYSVTNPDFLKITNDKSISGNPNDIIFDYTLQYPNRMWLFDKTYDHLVEIKSNVDMIINFYYDIDIQGNGIADKNEFVTIKYRIYEQGEFSPAIEDTIYIPFLYDTTFTLLAPEIPGYIAVGWMVGEYEYDNGWSSKTDIQHVERSGDTVVAGFTPTDVDHENNIITFIYRPAAEPVTVYWVGETVGKQKVTLGNITFNGYVGEEIIVKRTDYPVGGYWVKDLNFTTIGSPVYIASGGSNPDYFTITLGTDAYPDYKFGYREEKLNATITVNFIKEDSIFFTYVRTFTIGDGQAHHYVQALDGFYGYRFDSYDIYDMYENFLEEGPNIQVDVNPFLGDQIVNFYYVSTMIHVTIRAVDGYPESDTYAQVLFEETDEDVEIGMSFMAYAPYIEGYVLAPELDPAYETAINKEEFAENYIVRRIDNVSDEGEIVTFYYRPILPGQVTIFLREIASDATTPDPNARIIGVRTAIESELESYLIPDLSNAPYYYDEASLLNLNWNDPDDYEITGHYNIYYTKQMIKIQVIPIDDVGNFLLTTKVRF